MTAYRPQIRTRGRVNYVLHEHQLTMFFTIIHRLQPLALEAYVHMLRAGTPLFFVSNMIPKDSPEYEWMKLYLQGLDSFFHMRYEAAHQTFTTLDGMFPHNTDIRI